MMASSRTGLLLLLLCVMPAVQGVDKTGSDQRATSISPPDALRGARFPAPRLTYEQSILPRLLLGKSALGEMPNETGVHHGQAATRGKPVPRCVFVDFDRDTLDNACSGSIGRASGLENSASGGDRSGGTGNHGLHGSGKPETADSLNWGLYGVDGIGVKGHQYAAGTSDTADSGKGGVGLKRKEEVVQCGDCHRGVQQVAESFGGRRGSGLTPSGVLKKLSTEYDGILEKLPAFAPLIKDALKFVVEPYNIQGTGVAHVPLFEDARGLVVEPYNSQGTGVAHVPLLEDALRFVVEPYNIQDTGVEQF